MRKKIVAALIAGILVVTSAVPAYATPSNQEVNKVRDQYAELGKKIAETQNKVDELNLKIEPLAQKVESNKTEISNTKKEMDNTQKEIEQTKEKMSKQEEVLGGRLRELYKTGGQTSYLSLIFSADSLSDFIGKLDSANRLVDLDKGVVDELINNQNSLNEKMTSLQDKTKKLEELNAETQQELGKFEELKKEQEKYVEDAKKAQKEFDEKYLSQVEKEIISGQIATINNSNSSLDSLKSAVSQLVNLKNNQLKSPTVISEAEAAISKGKDAISRKEAEARAAAANNNPNRGGSVTNSGSSNNGGSSNNSKPSNNGGGQVSSASAQAILNEAYNHLGKPYVWGATGPNSFDCSGFTSYVYSKVTGRYIGRTTYDQIGAGRAVSRSELQPGDLVFPHAGHVGIYVGNGQIIHAPRTGDVVKVSPIWSFYAARRIL
ncbi:NlpC/P60 family protein [Clostridium baratii]|uniref:NlpC/P60 family protein n=1 Tax=Clostridium baratii str. Sullivan TaxID=1415775 RepID=A0A0A7G2A7_9CLOT|nr:C40 family peptidase [Clostridium baratii]AIY85151.1 nlpC/P60 family protein [Clostridium baratii str. Sullivan]MDU4912431.1 NlpC/P60 family protein [Clostridium baratii]CUP54767.1 SagA protein [Clostridium baratii]